jgi:hypothetical protein
MSFYANMPYFFNRLNKLITSKVINREEYLFQMLKQLLKRLQNQQKVEEI